MREKESEVGVTAGDIVNIELSRKKVLSMLEGFHIIITKQILVEKKQLIIKIVGVIVLWILGEKQF